MYYENNNFKLYYEKYGNNKNTILILPGWGDTRETFRYLIDNLKEENTIYIIDNPPFGKSKVKQSNLTIYDYSRLIQEFILNTKIDNPIVIAHSFGGRIATILSGYYNEKIKKNIFIDTAGIKQKASIKTKIYKLLRKLTNILPKKLKQKANSYLLKKFSSTDYYSLPDSMKETFKNIVNEDLSSYYKNIKQSTLLLWGELDSSTTLKDAEKMNKEIKDSALIVFKDATHYSYLQYPKLTLEIINEFIKEKA